MPSTPLDRSPYPKETARGSPVQSPAASRIHYVGSVRDSAAPNHEHLQKSGKPDRLLVRRYREDDEVQRAGAAIERADTYKRPAIQHSPFGCGGDRAQAQPARDLSRKQSLE